MNPAPTLPEHYAARILAAQQLVAARLDNPPLLAEVAAATHWSPYHFHRIFQAVTGETLGQLVARLRLERAAVQLRYGRRPAADVAVQVGYVEPAGFHRAFRRHFGVTPGAFRRQLPPAPPPPPGSPPVRTETLAQRVLWQVLEYGFGTDGFAQAAARGFGVLLSLAQAHGLPGPDDWLLGRMPDDPFITPPDKARYYAGIAVAAGRGLPQPPAPVLADHLPAGRYAVLRVTGQQHIVPGWNYLYGTWLPAHAEPHPQRLSFEVYRFQPGEPPATWRTDLYLPLA